MKNMFKKTIIIATISRIIFTLMRARTQLLHADMRTVYTIAVELRQI